MEDFDARHTYIFKKKLGNYKTNIYDAIDGMKVRIKDGEGYIVRNGIKYIIHKNMCEEIVDNTLKI